MIHPYSEKAAGPGCDPPSSAPANLHMCQHCRVLAIKMGRSSVCEIHVTVHPAIPLLFSSPEFLTQDTWLCPQGTDIPAKIMNAFIISFYLTRYLFTFCLIQFIIYLSSHFRDLKAEISQINQTYPLYKSNTPIIYHI